MVLQMVEDGNAEGWEFLNWFFEDGISRKFEDGYEKGTVQSFWFFYDGYYF